MSEDYARFDQSIDADPILPKDLAQNPVIREVLYAGQHLKEKLLKLDCDKELVGRIMYSAGQASFGMEPWAVHQEYFDRFIDRDLDFEEEGYLNVN